MRAIFLIAWKDFKQITTSPLFLIIAGLCTTLWSINYVSFIKQFATQSMMSQMQGGEGLNIIQSVFTQHISVTNLIFIFLLPLLTMRLIAEEKKSRSYDLLLTSPISATQIVVGKYLAGLFVTCCLLLLSFLYPLATGLVAKFSWPTLLGVYLGMFLLMALYTASGLFASSVTESALLAAFLGVGFNFLIWFVGVIGVNSDTKWFSSVMEYLSVGQHMMSFIKGTVQTSSVIFFITSIAFFVFLSQRVVESSRWR